jgi:prevent-host-death family protein
MLVEVISMGKRTMSAVEARQKLGEILEGVFYRGDEVVIERAGKPMGVVVPLRLYQSILDNRSRVRELIHQAQERNKDVPPEVLEREAIEAVREVRREMSGRRE